MINRKNLKKFEFDIKTTEMGLYNLLQLINIFTI